MEPSDGGTARETTNEQDVGIGAGRCRTPPRHRRRQGGRNCKVEDWRWYVPHGDTLAIEGASSCKEGRIVIRVYAKEGDERKFLGVADAYVDKPDDIAIRYTIDPEG